MSRGDIATTRIAAPAEPAALPRGGQVGKVTAEATRTGLLVMAISALTR